MSQYQSFPGIRGNSKSIEKLKALRLPDLKDKRFLDVGCNEGFFCGFAFFDGASEVVGVDKSRRCIEQARKKFPECTFIQQSWEELPEGPFDVILLASALHYAEDQENLIRSLMQRLSEDGILVLEIGIAQPNKNDWVQVKRSIDQRVFPTQKKIASILSEFAWKKIGFSVSQDGDPVDRFCFHVRKRKPYVFLLMEPSASGKTTICRTVFRKSKIPVISGDGIYARLAAGNLSAPQKIKILVQEKFSSTDIGSLTEQIFKQGLETELIETWCKEGGYQDFVLDSYVPEEFQGTVQQILLNKGYIPVVLNWNMDKTITAPSEACRKAEQYVEFLSGNHEIQKNSTADDSYDKELTPGNSSGIQHNGQSSYIRKWRKLKKDPHNFFADAKNPVVRKLRFFFHTKNNDSK